jgi:hypothetical protein
MTDPVKLSRQAVASFAAKRKPGYESALIAAAVSSDERSVTITRVDYDRLRDEFALACGPGCQLRRSLAWLRIRDDGSCGCNSYAAQMDAWGPDECLRRIEEIVEHLRQAAEKRGLIFNELAARQLVRVACGLARRNARKVASEGT